MTDELINDIYLSLQGLLIPEAAVPGVPDLFAPGSPCAQEYERLRAACERLCARLGVEEDEDLNCVLDSPAHIQAILCREMFRLGMEMR